MSHPKLLVLLIVLLKIQKSPDSRFSKRSGDSFATIAVNPYPILLLQNSSVEDWLGKGSISAGIYGGRSSRGEKTRKLGEEDCLGEHRP